MNNTKITDPFAGLDPIVITRRFLELPGAFENEKIAILSRITGYPESFLADRWASYVTEAQDDEEELEYSWRSLVDISFERDW